MEDNVCVMMNFRLFNEYLRAGRNFLLCPLCGMEKESNMFCYLSVCMRKKPYLCTIKILVSGTKLICRMNRKI